ncbi:lactation elevated protein 1-like isoform X2 [Asparagus officinalis]|uniref:lactation elevated protein 1-like isoform X2 n=1 Tax=Asparagus officinalis TaxID=4686 RepID=UPI00098E0D44|nr:lactation elevated protein 1-like isoform X2 [Asparagus officinalis]
MHLDLFYDQLCIKGLQIHLKLLQGKYQMSLFFYVSTNSWYVRNSGVNDVADALILNCRFGHLFSEGVVLDSTSNRAPDNLYEGGLQRDLFLQFIATLKDRCIAHAIGSSTDYRKMTNAEQGFYLIGHKYSGFLKQKFQQIIGEGTPFPQVVEVVMGRQLQVPLGANGCAYFPFEELCDRPLLAADYFGLFSKSFI